MKSCKKIKFSNYFKYVKDFPKKGINFLDWTPLMTNGKIYSQLINEAVKLIKDLDFDMILSPESRGYWLGCPIASQMSKGIVVARKKNKLPRETIKQTFDLEYGQDSLEISKNDIKKNQKVLIVDDILATGGTVDALYKLALKSKAKVVGCLFLARIPISGNDQFFKKNKIKLYIIEK